MALANFKNSISEISIGGIPILHLHYLYNSILSR
jgi:hypothetical protein